MIRNLQLALLLALLAPWSFAVAQEADTIDPQANQALQQMGEYLASLPHFRVRAELTSDEEVETGQLVAVGQTLDMVVRRPDGLWADLAGDDGHKRILYDGRTARLLDYTTGTAAETAAQATIEATVNDLIDRLGIVVPLVDLAFDDPYGTAIRNVETASYVGIRLIEGVEYHHLAFTQETVDWEIWIANNGRPLPGKVLIRYKNEPGSPQFTAIISEWDLSDGAPDALFSAETPIGFTPVEFIEVGGDR